jgi:hypothetical protein
VQLASELEFEIGMCSAPDRHIWGAAGLGGTKKKRRHQATWTTSEFAASRTPLTTTIAVSRACTRTVLSPAS